MESPNNEFEIKLGLNITNQINTEETNEHDTEMINEPSSASEAYEKFVRDLIVYYREQPVLWDKTHPKNRDKAERAKAMEELLLRCSDYPDATMDYVQTKLETIKCTFRREYTKVQQSKKTAKTLDDIFQPTLWYYNDMLFSVGADTEKDKLCVMAVRDKPNFIWNREDTLCLIDIIKDFSILYEDSSCIKNLKSKKMTAIVLVAERLSVATGKKYDLNEVRQKILRLKNQYWKEQKKLTREGIKPSLWCFNLLDFFKKTSKKSKGRKRDGEQPKKIKKEADSADLEFSEDYHSEDNKPLPKKRQKPIKKTRRLRIKKEKIDSKPNTTEKTDNCPTEDIFDVIGKHVVLKLNEMSHDQKKYAENLVNEILYHGMMENLRWDTKVTL